MATLLFSLPRNLPTSITIRDPAERNKLLTELQPCMRYSAGNKPEALLDTMVPMRTLPKAVDPYSGFTRHRVPVLRFGLPLTIEQLKPLLLSIGYPQGDIPRIIDEHDIEAIITVGEWLSEKIGWNVLLRNVWGSPPNDLMVEMYSNYTHKANYAPPNVVDALKGILETEEEPKWYLDTWRADWDWHLKK
ncbi:hypothetical protein M422DRAFT_780698 [Sphaerobolus stellatus SS14]|uniref:Unplaced genomic scaffold SPHSTscaffold_69, whole genome shotgun sequence n=1 Tax=Sphaerobolus stellatus (strain SS14) TaxID=990650 RepID=A0A0C9VQ96_SPHS4|nr:hypothetical protein M422DRAFT_780698 [Sphaerobolus stellatus SS14]